MKTCRIFVVNPGSTTTKIALFEGEKVIFTEELRHDVHDLAAYKTIYDQQPFRTKLVREALEKHKVDLHTIDAIACRGGNMKPVEGGTYEVTPEMLEDLRMGVMGQHASNLGAIIGNAIAEEYGLPVYVTDPVVVDEMEDVARISGCPEIPRKSKDHPLNQKAAARKAATDLDSTYEELNLILVHMGGGISVGIHRHGRMIDVNNSLDGDGPFSPERAGGIPFGSLIDICYSGTKTKEELRKHLVGKGGLAAYLGTNDARQIVRRINDGDEYARIIYEAMAYQISKEIGAGATVLKGQVDAIVLTGGLAYDALLTGWIKERVDFIAPVMIYAGEFEMEALAQGAIRVLCCQEQLKKYAEVAKTNKR